MPVPATARPDPSTDSISRQVWTVPSRLENSAARCSPNPNLLTCNDTRTPPTLPSHLATSDGCAAKARASAKVGWRSKCPSSTSLAPPRGFSSQAQAGPEGGKPTLLAHATPQRPRPPATEGGRFLVVRGARPATSGNGAGVTWPGRVVRHAPKSTNRYCGRSAIHLFTDLVQGRGSPFTRCHLSRGSLPSPTTANYDCYVVAPGSYRGTFTCFPNGPEPIGSLVNVKSVPWSCSSSGRRQTWFDDRKGAVPPQTYSRGACWVRGRPVRRSQDVAKCDGVGWALEGLLSLFLSCPLCRTSSRTPHQRASQDLLMSALRRWTKT